MNTLYNEAIDMGKTQSNFAILFSMIFLIIIAVCAIITYIYYNNNILHKNSNIVNATILEVKKCSLYTPEKSSSKYSCDLRITYTIDDKKYTTDIIADNYYKYKPNSTIEVYYDKNDPNVITIVNDTKFIWPFIVFFIVTFLTILLFGFSKTFYDYYMTRKYNLYSSIYGISGAFGHRIR